MGKASQALHNLLPSLWRALGSTRLALILLTLLLLTSLLASLLPQMPADSATREPWLAAVELRYRATTDLLHTLGLFDAYWDPRHSPRETLLCVQVGVVLFALSFLLAVRLAPHGWILLLFALPAGGLTGLAFPVAVACLPAAEVVDSTQARGPPGRRAGLLYAADLVGGCLGAATASVFLVPILGIFQTSLAIALVSIAGLALLL
jgi:hypothetical protein